ncbi:aminopeptidase N [Flaviflexus huanghaiensis]|uniref:aminopeptidase N n=1 Tax=Flaviflexus huanghaiensis TaxID=1111473 RepID=UPI0015FB0E6F|nr:aminopeptidase N [Flaviflexus huanghaiensis]
MPGENLTRSEAVERAAAITTERYRVELDLRGGDTFSSITTIEFAATAAETFVDLIGSVNSITLNGEHIDPSAHTDSRIHLTGLRDTNTLVVDATCRFMNTGEGMHKFVDPVDGETYLYTQFEVADARRVFAVFEQPDLKAEFTFDITAPSHWQVFSNSPTPAPSPVDEESSRWQFTPSERISSYLTAIIAGPYKGGTSELVSSDGRTIPLGVYCRASLAQHLDADEVIDITKAGFAFFEKEYGHPYPFRKYDQIFVPEFNAGAMENAGAVTITESYVFRSRATGAVIERRAITILHELAHMWFGDLVTMRWWNDLWLNESFAEFMSHLALDEATRWDQAWQTFLASEKSWAMNADQLRSTHPIVTDVSDLDEVWANFDGITYGKGAAVLKQLVAYVGRETFMTGLSEYFTKHAWQNTELSDLLAELEKASGIDLSDWSRLWLEESGVTLARPEMSVEAGTISGFSILQELGNSAHLRPHRMGIGLYDLDEGRLILGKRVDVEVAGERTDVAELVGEAAADLVLVNDGDLAYTKIRLDERSLETAAHHIGAFDDPLARTLVLEAAWDMCRDAEMSATAYTDLALAAIETEDHPTVLRMLLLNLAQAATIYSAPEHRDSLIVSVADALFGIADRAEAGSELQFQVALEAVRRAKSDSHLHRIDAWLDGNDLPAGFTLDTDGRWTVVQSLAAAGKLDETAIESELKNDDTATGREAAWRARASIPTPEAKEKAFDVLVAGELPNMQQRSALFGFQAGDHHVLEPFFSRYLDCLTTVWSEQTYEMAQQLATRMFTPSIIGRGIDVEGALDGWLAAHEEAAPALRRIIIEHGDYTRRALAAQAADS